MNNNYQPDFKINLKVIIPVAILILVIAILPRCYKIIPPGHVGTATIFGKVIDKPYKEGLKFPINPLYQWYVYDVREKTHKEQASVPSQDQLQTQIAVSVQYRLIGSQVPDILRNTGLAEDVLFVHLVPKLRSLIREQGKSIKRAEDFFLETTQEKLQTSLLEGLKTFLMPKGVEVQAVLIRDIDLPNFITKAIESKKEREQAVEKQKAELERYKTEMAQKVASARAERLAANEEAQRKKVLADAQAYEIKAINEAISDNPTYVQLKALETLQAMAKDPAAKLYFFNGDSSMPLPLMHIGEKDSNK